ncbi:MAG: hypothetical protein ACI4BD_05390 [Paludibacteraceae bacterium]
MRKLSLCAITVFAVSVMNAAVVNVDLTTGQQINNSYPVAGTVNASGELTVEYDFNTGVAWPNGGLEFGVDYLSEVTNLSFDLIGDLQNTNWTTLHIYLKDAKGTRWASSPSIGGTPTEWTTQSMLPSTPLWTTVDYEYGDEEIVAVGFMVNPEGNQKGQFQIRNVKLTYTEGETQPAENMMIDLSTAVQANTPCTWTLNENNELMVNYDLAAWDNGGPKFALPNIKVEKVESIQFEFIGDDTLSTWTSFQVYLEDNNGVKWYNQAADLHLNGIGTWTSKKYLPTDELWSTGSTLGANYAALVFLANPGVATKSSFGIRNVKINFVSTEPTSLEQTNLYKEAVKAIENGRLVIIRDGVRYNATGTRL